MNKLFSYLVFLFFAVTAFYQGYAQTNHANNIVKNLVTNNQVLLTNYAVFKKHKSKLNGASAFLINYQDKVYAVTAKHILGEAMGIKPEISPQQLSKYLISWNMFPRVPINPKMDTVQIGANLKYDYLDKDILLLEVLNNDFGIYPLSLYSSFPRKGDLLYIIGCPYNQPECKQNLYEIRFEKLDLETSTLVCSIKNDVELSGFSGAPIVDSNGKVVGVLVSGWEEGTTKYVAGTLITEIKNVK